MEQLQIIEAKVIWMPINDILFVVNQINEYLGLQLIDVKELTQNLEYYEENYTVFNCKIILAEPFSEYVQEIIHKWCNKEIIGDNRKWLSLNDIEKLHLDFILADKQIEAESFSFGTVVELNDFVEFYGSQKQNSDENLEYAINEIEVSFEHDCEKFSLFFVVSRKETYIKEPNDEIALPHHFEFDYSNISRMLLNKVSDSDNLEIYLYLKYPPLIYGIEERQKPEYFDDESSSEDLDPVPFRKTKFADCLESDITLSTVLKLEIPWYSAWEAVCNFVHNCKEVECFISPICTSFKNEIYPVPKIEVNFNCNYALQCILSRNNDIIMQLHMRNELISVEQKLNELASQDPNALEKALYKIYFALERKNIVIFSNALNSLFSKYNGIPNLNSDYSNLVSLRQAVLTPTRIIFLSPLTYLNNGLFKKFDADYAIHLSVRDENFQYLTDSLTEESSQNKIIPTIEKKLKEGFKIGNRQYNILGYNSKMLKDHSIMFCAEDSNGNGMETILKSISKSKQLKDTIGHMKFMEEMLTESSTSLEVNGINISEIHDKCIPSGSGRISPEVIKMVCDKLELDYIPSAMKVLYGGCELTLSMWPCLEGKQIIFNKSENNISSCNSHIEILKISKPKLVHLNRFLVMILSQLNVKDVTFFNLQEKMLKTMLRCFIDEKKAKHLFKAHNLFCINYDDLQEDFELLQEPFFQSLLQTIILKQLENLRKDTQISIPSSKGRTMLGIVDETKLLNPGEVFLQCSKDIWNNNTETDIITGSVLIVRSPCIHLSDVQKFTAVDIEELHHIKDCIVFSQKVQQNSMKVSYGDEYLVIWMDELQFPCLNPLVKEEEEILQSVIDKSTIEFFCDYIKNDKLESLYSAYLVLADKNADGIFSIKCKKIAKMYSECLKSFQTEKLEDKDDFLEDFPDFLDKKLQTNTYLSYKIVGQLYRRCQIMHADFENFVNSENTSHLTPDQDLDYHGRENYEESANKALLMYHNKLSEILEEYGIETEEELVSNSIRKLHIQNNKNLCSTSLIQFRIKMLVDQMRREFVKEFLKKTSFTVLNSKIINILCTSKYKDKVFQKASAWYMATFNQVGRRKYFGLPWTIYEILNKLKSYNQCKSNRNRSLKFQTKLDKMLNLYCPIQCEDDKHKAVIKLMHDLIYYEIFQSNKITQNETENLIIEIISHIFQILSPYSLDIGKKPLASEILLMLLERMSWLLFEKNSYYQASSSHFLNSQTLGRLAFEVLLNLVCLNNLDYFKMRDSKIEILQKATFRLSLDDNELSERFSHYGGKISQLMMDWTNVDSFQYRFKESNNKFFLLVRVIGSKYAINYCKTVIMQKDFAETIAFCISLDNTYD